MGLFQHHGRFCGRFDANPHLILFSRGLWKYYQRAEAEVANFLSSPINNVCDSTQPTYIINLKTEWAGAEGAEFLSAFISKLRNQAAFRISHIVPEEFGAVHNLRNKHLPA
jgi:hypothetical protein